ncbi:MAG: TonB-dependent receptor [Ginsengibacter sp.]|jgi:outer membrane receptor protein involved in Fe transport
MKTFFTLMLALFFTGTIIAQMPGGRPMGGQSMNAGRFYGKIVDANNKPLESASVQLSQQKMDTVTKKRKATILASIISDKKGDFSIDQLPVMGEFQLLITAVGYTPVIEAVSFGIQKGGDMKDIMNKIDKDLGNFKMVQDAQQLAGVVVQGNKPMLQMAIDRKVFNVDKSLTSIGGTAADVMKNVPSVNVDIDGNVTLRNAPPQIFVDGRPSTLSLDQIPAEEIESVEIITNPSAKFDASGGGSGILNIVLRKNRKAGYNGSVRANVDSRLSHGFGGNLNVKQGKVNFFANGMYNRRKGESTQSTQRIDVIDGMKATLSQAGNPDNTGNFAFGRAGIDFLVDNRNTISVAGSLVGGTFNNKSMLDIIRDSTIGTYSSHETGISSSNGTSKFQNTGGTASYKHLFAKPGKEITADVNYNLSNNSSNFIVGTQYYNPDKSPKGQGGLQKSTSEGKTEYYTLQTDFVNPINENMKLETGLRGAIRNYNSTNLNYIFNKISNDYMPIPAFNSEYKFKDEVYAGYVTFSQKINNFTYQAGGRIESSKYTGELIGSSQIFENSFPFSFFPSLFLTQKINENQDLQLNYSRKVNRPNFFQLIPYLDYSDSLNISRGNPGLKPEFTNLIELSYQVNLKKGNNILTTAYYRNTTDLITRYQYRDKNPIPAKLDSIFISSYENANSSVAYGLEVTSTNKLSRWWNLTTNVNVYNSTIDGGNIESNLNNQQVSWFGKINNTFTLPKAFSIQLTGDYTSKTILPPGRGGGGGGRMYGGGNLSTANGYTEPVYGIDLAIKKDFLKDKSASISLSMNDLLRTKVYRTHSRSDFSKTVYSIQDNERRRDAQLVRLNLSWRFGKFDTSLFKRKNMKADQEGMQSGMEGMQQ